MLNLKTATTEELLQAIIAKQAVIIQALNAQREIANIEEELKLRESPKPEEPTS